MKLLNQELGKMKFKSSIEEEIDKDEFEVYDIFSHRCAIFLTKSEEEALDYITKADKKMFISKHQKITFLGFNEYNFLIQEFREPCPQCDSYNLVDRLNISEYIDQVKTSKAFKKNKIDLDHELSKDHKLINLCLNCGNKFGEEKFNIWFEADDTITFYEYSDECLLVINMYSPTMLPIPDNIMLVKYILEMLKTEKR